jgi:hypothetical protein
MHVRQSPCTTYERAWQTVHSEGLRCHIQRNHVEPADSDRRLEFYRSFDTHTPISSLFYSLMRRSLLVVESVVPGTSVWGHTKICEEQYKAISV